jgi:FkbM family methyltransferase
LVQHRYVIVACARWETPYIREWIAYHQAIGFDHIYLYCNDDDPADFRAAVLADPAARDFVTLRHFAGQGQQSAMYRDALQTIRTEAEWVTFLDIDEFLVLRTVNNVHSFMVPFEASADSVYFNWLMFGNNGFVDRPAGSVLQNYTRRAASLDPHTKHITRVSKLTAEKLAAPGWPFWHGLANPLWSDLRRVNVLGQDWGHYLDDFPGHATTILSDPVLTRQIVAVAAVNHYVFKSEADFTLRAQRGLGGQFAGQIKWAELHRTGEHIHILQGLSETDDTYLRDFANQRRMHPSVPGQRTSVRRILARNTSWQSELELDGTAGRVLNRANGAGGTFKERQGLLVVEWDHWPLEVFVEINGVYQGVRNAAPPAHAAPIGLNRSLAARLGDSIVPVASVGVHIPAGGVLHLRPGTSDIPVYLAIFVTGEYASLSKLPAVNTIIDLGANTGLSAAYFARIYPGATIIALEPEAGNYRMLELNVHGLSNVEPLHAAIWSHDTELEIDSSENGVRRDDWAFRSREVGQGGDRVRALSIATLLANYQIKTVDILKVDIEGAEVELFSTGTANWLPKVKYLVVETHERFRPGSDAIVSRAMAATHAELEQHSEDRIFIRRDLLSPETTSHSAMALAG